MVEIFTIWYVWHGLRRTLLTVTRNCPVRRFISYRASASILVKGLGLAM